jgi:redox-sensitive bicupin YhaK (pirin superfamily)
MPLLQIPPDRLYRSEVNWRTSRYHFSFADYHDTERIQFGVLRALNDETIQSNNGFDLHPHAEMEILSYCVQGELNHKDNIGNDVTIRRGEVQYMCAGSGMMHAEMNLSTDQLLRFIQIWILPNQDGLTPSYEYKSFQQKDRLNKWLLIASGNGFQNTLQIHQDANVFVTELLKGEQIEFATNVNRQTYLVCLEGKVITHHIELEQHGALRISNEESAMFKAVEDAHLLLVEMAAR